ERCSDFILPAVAFSDISAVIILTVIIFAELCIDLLSPFIQLFGKRQHTDFYRCKRRMEVKDCTHIRFFFCSDIFLVVSAAEECQHHTVRAERRLDYVRNVFLLCLVVKVCQILSGYVLMLCQIIICTVRDAPQLAPAEREEKFHVCGSLAVEGKLLFVMVAVTYFIVFQSERRQPVQAEALPVFKAFQVSILFAEEFQFHLLELSCTECNVARRDLIAERFSDLSDTERQLLS